MTTRHSNQREINNSRYTGYCARFALPYVWTFTDRRLPGRLTSTKDCLAGQVLLCTLQTMNAKGRHYTGIKVDIILVEGRLKYNNMMNTYLLTKPGVNSVNGF